jgi:hypothetical protein
MGKTKRGQSEQRAVLGAMLKRVGTGEPSVLAKAIANDLDHPSCGMVNEVLGELASDALVEVANPGEQTRRWRLTEQGRVEAAAAAVSP